MKILMMEDDPKITAFVQFGLEENGCTIDLAYDSAMGEKLAFNKKYDVIILDVIVPGVDGFEVCKRIRNHHIKTPILMLTSLDSIDDKVIGFDSGADDYLLKPFQFQELLARLRALNRRNKDTIISPSLLIADMEINTISKKVKRGGREIKLTAHQYKILELLAGNKGKVFDRMEIIEKIWGASFDSGTNVIDVHINALRNKIDKNCSQKLIQTVFGVGYALNDE